MPLTAPRYDRAMGSSSYRGIQTIRNWPGWPPRSARKRYVIVVGVSRTISRRGTTWILGMSDPNRLRNRVEARFLEEGGHFLYDFVEDAQAPRENCGPDLHRARAGHGESGDVLDVRRELGKDGDVDDVLHRAGEVPDRRGVLGDFGPEAFRVRTGQVQLDRLHAVRGHLRRDGCVLLGVLAEDGADHDRARGVGPLDLMFVLDDARIREADRIQQTGI